MGALQIYIDVDVDDVIQQAASGELFKVTALRLTLTGSRHR